MDYYKELDLPRNCSDNDIKKAYKKLAIKWHPVFLNNCRIKIKITNNKHQKNLKKLLKLTKFYQTLKKENNMINLVQLEINNSFKILMVKWEVILEEDLLFLEQKIFLNNFLEIRKFFKYFRGMRGFMDDDDDDDFFSGGFGKMP